MAHTFLGDVTGCEEMLASGDASTELQLSESLLGLLPDPILAAEDVALPLDTSGGEGDPPRLLPAGFNFAFREMYFPRHGKDQTSFSQEIIKPSDGDLETRRAQRPSKPTLRLAELAALLECRACHSLPMTALTVHTCEQGHQVCGHCFHAGHRKCQTCNMLIQGRNEVLEAVLQRLQQVCPELFTQQPSPPLRADDSPSTPAVQHSSHKPLACPHLSCNRVVAVNGFLAHFRYEHPSVPACRMLLGHAQTFSLSTRCLLDTLPGVVNIIEVIVAANTPEVAVEDTSCSVGMKTTMFPVRRDAVICVLQSCTVQRGDYTFLAAWCSFLHEQLEPLQYTLRAHSTSGSSVCYTGNITSLHQPHEAQHTLKEARCLVLAPHCFTTPTPDGDEGALPLELKFEMIHT